MSVMSVQVDAQSSHGCRGGAAGADQMLEAAGRTGLRGRAALLDPPPSLAGVWALVSVCIVTLRRGSGMWRGMSVM